MKNAKTLTAVGAASVAALIAITSVAHAKSADYAELSAAPTDIAAAIAVAKAAAPGKVMEAELELEDGKLIWEVKVMGEDRTRTKLEIDTTTGEILEQKSKQKRHKRMAEGETGEKRKGGRHNLDLIDIEQALEIAAGESDGLVVEAELERKRGTVVWEIETVDADNNTVEIRIDGQSGELL